MPPEFYVYGYEGTPLWLPLHIIRQTDAFWEEYHRGASPFAHYSRQCIPGCVTFV